jgi:hypothetical protein
MESAILLPLVLLCTLPLLMPFCGHGTVRVNWEFIIPKTVISLSHDTYTSMGLHISGSSVYLLGISMYICTSTRCRENNDDTSY